MPTYLSLFKATGASDGETSFKDEISEGAPETRKLIEAHGGALIEVYLTMGQYDLAMLTEFPDETKCAQALMALRDAMGGSSETMRAFPERDWPGLSEGI